MTLSRPIFAMRMTPTGLPSLGAASDPPTVGWSPGPDVVVVDEDGWFPTRWSWASKRWRRTDWLWDSAMPVPHSWYATKRRMSTPKLRRILPSTPVMSPRRTYSTLPTHGAFRSAWLGYTRLVQVLFVCTANMCRSPMAAALFGRLVPVEADDALEEVSVVSAGLLQGGYASPPEVVTVMAEMGIDLSGHSSRQLSPDLVVAADLVLCMA